MFRSLMIGAAMLSSLACAAPASAQSNDVFGWLQTATLTDVQTAEAIYAANPGVPTAPAATQCLGWVSGVLSSGVQAPFTLEAPTGIASSVADLDVALSSGDAGVPPIVEQFNKNCGWYVEDLKAEAAAVAAKRTSLFFGLVKF